jgi:signal transduction histidine kinase
MRKQIPCIPRIRLGTPSWSAALIGIVIVKAVLLLVKPIPSVTSYSGISYLLLLVLGTCSAIRNGIRHTLGGRLFWTLVAIAYGLWAAHQGIGVYYELARHAEVPDDSIADSLLFLHVSVLSAAVATLPHCELSGQKPYTPMLNAALVVLFWLFVYGYAVFPYQYLFRNVGRFGYGLRFDLLYLLENLALVLALGILALREKTPWRSIYIHLLAACTVYALSSTVTNLAIDSGGYVNGKLYGLGLTASVCWFVWIPLSGRPASHPGAKAAESDVSQGSQASEWAMVVVVMISFPIAWELLQHNENAMLRALRVAFAVAMITCLASTAYIKEYLAKRELASRFGVANDRLHLAMKVGTSVAWETDVRTRRAVCFGDLQTILGIPSDRHVMSVEELISYMHPDDRSQVLEALADARRHHRLFAREFRIVRPDGIVRWLEARGKFYFSKDGSPERMIGVSLDTTERKRAADSAMTRKLVEAQEQERARIARELHDNITQHLAILAIELSQLRTKIEELPAGVRDRVHQLQQMASDLSTEAHALSHELHSSTLEYLGFVKGMRSWCKEFGARQKLEIDFRSDDVPTPSQEISLCLFRILQEALQNAAKHSGVSRVEVELAATSAEIHLIVRDKGKGFDIESARQSRGLGLTSIEERIRLVGGTMGLASRPLDGTTIHVRVPFKAEPDYRTQATSGKRVEEP